MGVIDLVKSVVFAVRDAALITIDIDEVTKNARKQVDAVDAANKAKNPPEADWRGELEELDRRLRIVMTTTQAKAHADGEAYKHTEAVQKIMDEIKYVKSLLDEPGLRRCTPLRMGRPPVTGDTCDVCLFNRKIASLEILLGRAKNDQAKSIRLCGGLVQQARELDPLRPRWKELRKRAAKIDTARKAIGGLVDGRGPGMHPEAHSRTVRTPEGYMELPQPE